MSSPTSPTKDDETISGPMSMSTLITGMLRLVEHVDRLAAENAAMLKTINQLKAGAENDRNHFSSTASKEREEAENDRQHLGKTISEEKIRMDSECTKLRGTIEELREKAERDRKDLLELISEERKKTEEAREQFCDFVKHQTVINDELMVKVTALQVVRTTPVSANSFSVNDMSSAVPSDHIKPFPPTSTVSQQPSEEGDRGAKKFRRIEAAGARQGSFDKSTHTADRLSHLAIHRQDGSIAKAHPPNPANHDTPSHSFITNTLNEAARFSGLNGTGMLTFLVRIGHVYLDHPDSYGFSPYLSDTQHRNRIQTLVDNLDGPARQWACEVLEKGSDTKMREDYHRFSNTFVQHWVDPREVSQIGEQVQGLRHSGQAGTVAGFTLVFNCMAKILRWPEDQMYTVYKAGLHPNLLSDLARQPTATALTLRDLQAYAHQWDRYRFAPAQHG